MSRRHALDAEISACETELRYLGVQSSVNQRAPGLEAAIDIYYLPAVNDFHASQQVENVTGQRLYGDEMSEVQLKIRFGYTPQPDRIFQPVALIFSNGCEWVCSRARVIGDTDWTNFIVNNLSRPDKTTGRIDSFDNSYIELAVSTYGPPQMNNNEDFTSSAIGFMSFWPKATPQA